MTQPYWFTRSFSDSKPMKRKGDSSKVNELDQKKEKDLLAQAKSNSLGQAEKITTITQTFSEYSRLNQLAHEELIEAGSIK